VLRERQHILHGVKARKIRYFGDVIRNDRSATDSTLMTGIVPGRMTGHRMDTC